MSSSFAERVVKLCTNRFATKEKGDVFNLHSKSPANLEGWITAETAVLISQIHRGKIFVEMPYPNNDSRWADILAENSDKRTVIEIKDICLFDPQNDEEGYARESKSTIRGLSYYRPSLNSCFAKMDSLRSNECEMLMLIFVHPLNIRIRGEMIGVKQIDEYIKDIARTRNGWSNIPTSPMDSFALLSAWVRNN